MPPHNQLILSPLLIVTGFRTYPEHSPILPDGQAVVVGQVVTVRVHDVDRYGGLVTRCCCPVDAA
jgi:hypothetical protein